jgi:hypothetical protein
MIYLGMRGMFGPSADATGRLPLMAPFLRMASTSLRDVFLVAGRCEWEFVTAWKEDGKMLVEYVEAGGVQWMLFEAFPQPEDGDGASRYGQGTDPVLMARLSAVLMARLSDLLELCRSGGHDKTERALEKLMQDMILEGRNAP